MKRENWESIAKHLVGENLNPEEESSINEMKRDAELNQLLNESQNTINKVDLYFKLKKVDTNRAWHQMQNQLPREQKRISLRTRVLQIAAVFIFLMATGLTTWKLIETSKTNTYKTAHNDLSHPELILPDGSKVHLNYNSKLVYPKQFNGTTRTVELDGEAFFEVSPNAEKPFIINTKNTAVKVLGTSFNVSAYEGDEKVEVLVKTGKVEFMPSNAELALNNKVVLLPGEKGTYLNSTQTISKELVLQLNDLAWLSHEIKFEFTNLSEVIQTLEHSYQLKIIIDRNVDINQKITATFNQQNPDYIMEVVAITLDLQLKKINPNSYLIKNK
ncbi:MAG: FecR family protein [Prolixibacteraceae bacterium]